MIIKAKELMENGVEVDMPVDWEMHKQSTIRYDKERKQFVLADIKTGEIHYAYDRLADLVRLTNKIYADKGIKDEVEENDLLTD